MRSKGAQVPLDRVRIEEGVRGLNQKQARVGREMADRLPQEGAERHMVGIEDDDDLALRMLETVIEVAGLGVLVARPGQIGDAERLAEGLKLAAPLYRLLRFRGVGIGAFLVGAAVIEQPDMELVGRVVDELGGGQGRGENPRILVVARNEDVDGGQVLGRAQGRRGAAQRIGVDDEADEEDEDAVEFAQQQDEAEPEAHRIGRGRQRVRDAPEHVAQDHEAPESQEDEPRRRIVEENP